MTDAARERRRDALAAGALWLGLSALFWLGRSRSFGPGDSPQHVLSALLWGVPQAPGYPLQVELGWLWSRLPWADPGAAVNGLSGLLAAAAAAVLYLLLRRAKCRRAAALTGAALMALSPLFWYYSLVAEVRALNDLLALGGAYFAADWAREGRARSLWAFAAVFGLGVSHHPTYVLLIPAYAVWLFARRVPPRRLAAAAAISLAALAAPYLLLGLRLARSTPAYDLPDARGWSGLLGLFLRENLGGPLRAVSGAGFFGFGGFDLRRLAVQTGWFLSALWTHAGPAGLLLGALGAAALWKTDRRSLLAWALWAAVSAGVFILISSQQITICHPDYARAVVTRFYLLPMIALFALSGHGAEALAARVRPLFAWALAAAVLVLPLSLRPLSLARSNGLLDYARALVADAKPGDMIVLAADDSIFATLDLELARGEGGDRVFLTPSMFSYPPYIRSLHRRYPGLRVPPAGPRGLTTDWTVWRRLNPGRAVLMEPSLLDTALALYPRSVPQGTLIRIETRPPRDDPAADARRFLSEPATWSLTRWDVRPWTQEIYVLSARRRQAEWIGSRLNPRRDRALIARLKVLLAAL
ncbi:MAG: DUF2723 domain-containing protein [Elusimicrobia bacterium]|nr:DUF2723 domain-containing protein [Elusimicrobiota bacterium]